MSELNPRQTLAQIAGLYGYDPATVLSVWISPEEVVFRVRIGDPEAGRYTLVDSGFLIRPGVKLLLDGMAAAYGYVPSLVVRVCIDQRESAVRYLAPFANGEGYTIQSDVFVIPEPVVPPAVAATDTGAIPPIPDPEVAALSGSGELSAVTE